MHCDQCNTKMINVGRMIKPGDRSIWSDAYLCQKKRCPGYAVTSHDASTARWPAATLDSAVPLHAMIRGAMRFRDAV